MTATFYPPVDFNSTGGLNGGMNATTPTARLAASAAYSAARANILNQLTAITQRVEAMPETLEGTDVNTMPLSLLREIMEKPYQDLGVHLADARAFSILAMKEQGMDHRKIADRLGISFQAVSKIVNRTFDRLASDLHRQGATVDEIADRLGITPNKAAAALNRVGKGDSADESQ